MSAVQSSVRIEAPSAPQAAAQGQARPRFTPGYIVRLTIASVVAATWGLIAIYSVYTSWLAGKQAQAAAVPAARTSEVYISQVPTYREVLRTARTACPLDMPLLLLNNGSAALELSHYYLYPRKVTSFDLEDRFGRTDLLAHKGGCLATYGTQNASRIKPFDSQLEMVVCSSEGCLFQIKQ